MLELSTCLSYNVVNTHQFFGFNLVDVKVVHQLPTLITSGLSQINDVFQHLHS